MTKKYEYMSIEGGRALHPGLPIAQAVHLLDLAATMATDKQDIDQMVKISSRWLTMGERLAEILEVDDSGDEEESEEEKAGFGFNSQGKSGDKEVDDGATDGD
jgi:hypothetical protein